MENSGNTQSSTARARTESVITLKATGLRFIHWGTWIMRKALAQNIAQKASADSNMPAYSRNIILWYLLIGFNKCLSSRAKSSTLVLKFFRPRMAKGKEMLWRRAGSAYPLTSRLWLYSRRCTFCSNTQSRRKNSSTSRYSLRHVGRTGRGTDVRTRKLELAQAVLGQETHLQWSLLCEPHRSHIELTLTPLNVACYVVPTPQIRQSNRAIQQLCGWEEYTADSQWLARFYRWCESFDSFRPA